VTGTSIDVGLAAARRVVDQGWQVYDGSPDERRARRALVQRAVDAGFPSRGIRLTEADVRALAEAAITARRTLAELDRLRQEDEARHARLGTDASRLAAFGSRVAAGQAGDWVRLVDQLRSSTRRYQIVEGDEAAPPARRRTVERFARRCAAELGIATPTLGWIRPVRRGGDVVTLGDVAGFASVNGQAVIFVRTDITSDRDRLRVVAHEVAHHGGADEREARAYELIAVRRHGGDLDLEDAHSRGNGDRSPISIASNLPG
jgi:hypothetical protein